MVREGRLIECLENDLYLLLEQLAVGIFIKQRCTEYLDFTCVVTASYSEDDAPICKNVGGGIILG